LLATQPGPLSTAPDFSLIGPASPVNQGFTADSRPAPFGCLGSLRRQTLPACACPLNLESDHFRHMTAADGMQHVRNGVEKRSSASRMGAMWVAEECVTVLAVRHQKEAGF